MTLLANSELIENNVNHAHDIDTLTQEQLRLGNTQFIIDLAIELKVSE